MPHIHTKAGQHDHTVSAYIIRTDFDEPKIILHKHRLFSKWLQFGGHVELNETPWQAISHEVPEESGYDMSQLQILQPKKRVKSMGSNQIHPIPATHFTHPFPELNHHHTDTGFLFITDQTPKHKLADRESKEIELYTLEELKSLPGLIDGVLEVFEFAIEVGLKDWEPLATRLFDSK